MTSGRGSSLSSKGLSSSRSKEEGHQQYTLSTYLEGRTNGLFQFFASPPEDQ